jgi:hypothetical protein
LPEASDHKLLLIWVHGSRIAETLIADSCREQLSYARCYGTRNLRMSQALDECCGIKSLDALFHREDRPGSENRICGFIPFAPIVKLTPLGTNVEAIRLERKRRSHPHQARIVQQSVVQRCPHSEHRLQPAVC